MSQNILAAALGLIALVAAGLSFALGRKQGASAETAKQQAARVTADDERRRLIGEGEREAESLRKAAVLSGKEEVMQQRETWESEARKRRDELVAEERKLVERETGLERRGEAVETRDRELGKRGSEMGRREKLVQDRQVELDQLLASERSRLEGLAGLTAAEAKQELVRRLEEEAHADAANRLREIRETARRNADREVRRSSLSPFSVSPPSIRLRPLSPPCRCRTMK